MPKSTDANDRGQAMTREHPVLREAERWFRAILRGAAPLSEPEFALFAAIAERQTALGDVYLPVETKGSAVADPFAGTMPVTLPPPSSSAQRALIEKSKATIPPKR